MKVLILGASGMFGHKVAQILSKKLVVVCSFRRNILNNIRDLVFEDMELIVGVDANDIETVFSAIESVNPDVVVNCIGIVKQLPDAKDFIKSIQINALYPHQVAKYCREKGIRFIHISTDCVFSGEKGNYHEYDFADANDLYGRTKYLGEVDEPECLTLRTSIVGRELSSSNGLFEWFFSQAGQQITGYSNVIFSGLTTNALSKIISEIIINHPELQGLYNISSEPIDKYSLLSLLNEKFKLNVNIIPDNSIESNKSLNSEKFRNDSGMKIPSWSEMIDELYLDKTPYDTIRR